MHEVFPVVAGIVIGFSTQRLIPAPFKTVALVVLGVVAGVFASFISGELAISWGFILIDIPQVLIVAALTWGLVTLWQRRSAHVR